jgi:hypothetical protein
MLMKYLITNISNDFSVHNYYHKPLSFNKLGAK